MTWLLHQNACTIFRNSSRTSENTSILPTWGSYIGSSTSKSGEIALNARYRSISNHISKQWRQNLDSPMPSVYSPPWIPKLSSAGTNAHLHQHNRCVCEEYRSQKRLVVSCGRRRYPGQMQLSRRMC